MNSDFKYSVVNGSTDSIDYYSPATFLEWFKQQSTLDRDINLVFLAYKNYVIQWGQVKKKTQLEINNVLRDSYVQVLREIVINFTTEEEKRFITNADFTNPRDLDIILPFFIEKLKNICLFYINTREEVKTASIQHGLRGSILGVENLTKKLIFDAARTNQIDFTQLTCSFPPLSAIARGLSVYVEELYDTTDTYFNINPDTVFNYSSERNELSSFNLNFVNKEIFVDFKQAIINAINEYPAFLQTLGTNNFNINLTLSGTELNFLKERDFINYLSGGEAELKLNLLKTLAPKFAGSDFYYLSTGNTTNNRVSGMLFSVNNTYSSPTLNFLNKQYPTTATVPNLNELFTEYQIGRFFLPQFNGLLIHNTPNKTYSINLEELEPNTIYAFPDPNIIGNVSYNSTSNANFIPLMYKIDVEWNKKSRSNQFAFGDVLSNSYNQLYYGYQSHTQDRQIYDTGLSRVEDNVQFWGGDKQSIWLNDDVWPGLNKTDTLPYISRQNNLLAGNLTPVYWGSDVYGNEYGVLKDIFSLNSLSGIEYNDGGLFNNSNTLGISASSIPSKSVYNRKYITPGIFYFRGIDNIVSPASAALSAIFTRYPAPVREELSSSVLYFNLYFDTFVIETVSYVVVDTINYDVNNSKITIGNNSGIYFNKVFTNNKIEKFAGEWFSEKTNTLYIAFLSLLPYLSASNYKIVYPTIYKTPLTNIKLDKIYPTTTVGPEFAINSYSLSAGFAEPPQIDLISVEGISFNKSEKTSLFNISYLGKNLNGMPLFVNEQLKEGDWDIYLQTFNPRLFRPYYFIYDNNYSNPSMPYLVKYAGSVGGVMGGQALKESNVKIGFNSAPGELTFLYADGVLPVQLNAPGTYTVQFDWESFVETTIFIGCSGYKVKKVNDVVIFNSDTPDSIFFDYYGEVADIQFTSIFSTLTGVSALTPTPTNILQAFSYLNTNTTTLLSSKQIYSTNLQVDTSLYSTLIYSTKKDLTLNHLTSSLGIDTFKINSLNVSNSAVITLTISPSTNLFNPTTGQPLSGFLYLFAPYTALTAPINCRIERPTFPDASVLKFTVTTPLTSNENIKFCETPELIYKDLFITQSGPGSGVILTDPFCLECFKGGICTQQYPFNTSLSIIASSNVDSQFIKWVGGPCDQSTFPDCIYVVTDTHAITAVFDIIPYYNVRVTNVGFYNYPSDFTNNFGGLFSTDTKINCPSASCAADYRKNTFVSLSCLVPLSGWYFMGWEGGKCANITDRNYCSFSVEESSSISALYTRYYDHILTAASRTTSTEIANYGYVYSTTPFNTYEINVSGITTFGVSGNSVLSLTGVNQTNSLSSILGTFVELSAKTSRGHRFLGWDYTPKDVSDNYIQINNDKITIDRIASNVSVTANFDIGYYTLLLNFLDSGNSTVYNEDFSINSRSQDGTASYLILSGSNLIVDVAPNAGNTIMELSSRNVTTGFGVSSFFIRMDDNRSLNITTSAILLYQLNLDIYYRDTLPSGQPVSFCGAITSRPAGLSCFAGPCQRLFVAGTEVFLVPPDSTSTCKLCAFYAGNSITYYYRPGPGIKFTGPQISDHQFNQPFFLGDSSLILAPTGAPYMDSSSITISNGEVSINLAGNRSVSAVFR